MSFFSRIRWLKAAMLFVLVACATAQETGFAVHENQKPVLKVFRPSAAERTKPGVGKFIIFTREPTSQPWDYIVGAWECIPSRPDLRMTKRVEFCHSSWSADLLLNVLVADDSYGMHPRFLRLQVNKPEHDYSVNLYDINYRTWDVRCLWQGDQCHAFGVMKESIFCGASDGWWLLDVGSGKIKKRVPFIPVDVDGDYWLVRKSGETNGCHSYDRNKQRFVARFGPVEEPASGFTESRLSSDGRNRAWVIIHPPSDWEGGATPGKLILQRDGRQEDISVPIELWAYPGSGVPVIPVGIRLSFVRDAGLEFRARKGQDDPEDRVWNIDLVTGRVRSITAPHLVAAPDSHAVLHGVPVPGYLRPYVGEFTHFGRSGLAPAFLLHLGILKGTPGYPDCTTGVSPDGRHVLYRAVKGPLSDVYIYGDLVTKETVRWKAPENLGNAEEFVWVETPR